MEFSLKLPGSTANLGPGYDALGLALGIYNRVTVRTIDAEKHRIRLCGCGCGELPLDGSNLFFQAAETLAERLDLKLPRIEAEMTVGIPLARGLGSSSTAIVGGVVAANRLLDDPLSRAQLLDVATEMEGHPDNVSPCLYGGFTVSMMSDGHVTCVHAEPPPELRTVVVIPDFQLKTQDARDALPDEVSHRDATFNVGRSSVLTAAMLQGDLDAVGAAMQDRMHQPYRAALIPNYDAVTAAAIEAGALGVALSGAGPSLFAITKEETSTVGEAMVRVWEQNGITATVHELPVDLEGTVIE